MLGEYSEKETTYTTAQTKCQNVLFNGLPGRRAKTLVDQVNSAKTREVSDAKQNISTPLMTVANSSSEDRAVTDTTINKTGAGNGTASPAIAASLAVVEERLEQGYYRIIRL